MNANTLGLLDDQEKLKDAVMVKSKPYYVYFMAVHQLYKIKHNNVPVNLKFISIHIAAKMLVGGIENY